MPTTDQILADSKAMLSQTKAQGSTPFAGSSFDTVITPDSLKSVTPAIVTSPTPSSTASSIIAEAGSLAGMTNEQQKVADQAKLDMQASKDTLTSLTDTIGMKGAETTQMQIDAGIPAKVDTVKQNNLQIAAIQNATNQEKERLTKIPGMTQAGLQGLYGDIDNRNAFRITDLTIQNAITNQDISTLQTGIDNAIKLKFEPLENRLALQAKFYEDNKSLFTDAESKVFELNKAKAQSEIDAGKTDAANKYKLLSTAMENGVTIPANIVSKINGKDVTSQQAMGILQKAGITLVNPADLELKRAQIANTNASAAKTRAEAKAASGAGSGLTLPQDYSSFLASRTPSQTKNFNSLPAGDQSVVAQLVSGDALLTDLVKSRGAAGTADIQRYIQEATAVDPNFSVNNNKIKYTANQQWNAPNGKAFLTRSSMNTAMSHMATTYDAALALGNTKIPKYNDIANWAGKNTGNPALTNFVYDLTALSGEIATAYKNGTAATDQETEKFYNAMSGGMSPKQLKGVFDNASKLMAGKLRSLSQEYEQTTGAYPTDPIIQPYTLSELKRVGVDTSSIDSILKQQGYAVSAINNNLQQEDVSQINSLFGGSSSITTGSSIFNPASWYTK